MKPSAGGHSGRNRQSARAAAAARQGQDRCRRPGVAAACQDVEDDVGGVDLSPIASARPLHGRETVGQHRRENLDHLKVASEPFSLCRTRSRPATAVFMLS